ncbi:MAG: neutral/alkaline non-lysosomal ceramidase N-terminal domain-containing protein [Chloroflexota bacterium]
MSGAADRTALPDDPGAVATFAGFAVRELTVNPGAELSGYPFVDRRATGVHDRLRAVAMVAGEGPGRVALVGLDLIAAGAGLVRDARERIAAAVAIPGDRVMIAATHTHSGPAMGLGRLFDDGVVGTPDLAFERHVVDAIVAAVSGAAASSVPVRLVMGRAPVDPPVGGNRRRPDGYTDPTVTVLAAFDDASRLAGMVVGMGMHPTVLQADNLLVSGDLAWGVRSAIETRLADSPPCLQVTGAAGDQSTRLTLAAATPDEAYRLRERAAAAVAAAVPRLAARPAPTGACRIGASRRMIELPVRTLPPVADAEAADAGARAGLERARQEGAPVATQRTAEVVAFGTRHTLRYARLHERQPYPASVPAEVQAFAIGGIAIVGIPVELFAGSGRDLLERSPHAPLLVAYANDLLGYAPPRSAYLEGGYEPTVTLLAEGACDRLLDAAEETLREATTAAAARPRPAPAVPE